MGSEFLLRFQWWLLSKKVTSLLYWKWHHAHTSIGDGRKCQYRSNGRRHKGFKSKSLSKTSCLLESRMLDEATVPLCLPRKSGKTQAILQSSETAGGDTAAKEKRRSNSLNISTYASFSIWKVQCNKVSNSRARIQIPRKAKTSFYPNGPKRLGIQKSESWKYFDPQSLPTCPILACSDLASSSWLSRPLWRPASQRSQSRACLGTEQEEIMLVKVWRTNSGNTWRVHQTQLEWELQFITILPTHPYYLSQNSFSTQLSKTIKT